MRIGIDSFTLRELNLDPYQCLDYANKRGLEGVQFGGMDGLSSKRDVGELLNLRNYADSLGMYINVSVGVCNPLLQQSEDEARTAMILDIQAFAKAGWHELAGIISRSDERYKHPVPWNTHLSKSADFVRSLRPVLEACGSRINLENHGDSTFDILHVVEAAGSDICGVNLDTGNTLVNAEDPVLAARRVAPYTHLTHIKDGIVFFSANGVSRQGKAPGQGIVDLASIIAILGEYNPDLPLSIEDHKWIFEFPVFEQEWFTPNQNLTPYEFGQFIKLVKAVEQKLASGELPAVDAYEAIPYLAQMEERIASGAECLRGILEKLNLQSGK
ncbi:sugar phosphate isomerase/epimerase [Paenibacillus sp. HWE-109]|uniref:sugar phosphate isomerase/epimerase family protein n=1 Tax=Paenibacillus sp. HWE-109 TaxID=1306526 RepID=UPI001EE0869D|nr:sugar phosphate isomerase/epimerase [Paenibacillus sp. HWE-109]UKS28334.1 sugar phosphate isomerase/epimerase [Paenibacillus sp. HWE-109]